jgi:hypothetical protein
MLVIVGVGMESPQDNEGCGLASEPRAPKRLIIRTDETPRNLFALSFA